eukprot:3833410-Amphidinium_carterae.1
MVTKTNVRPHPKQACVVASTWYLPFHPSHWWSHYPPGGQFHAKPWVEQVKLLDVISICNMRQYMKHLYQTRGRCAKHPMQADPTFGVETSMHPILCIPLHPMTAAGARMRLDIEDDDQMPMSRMTHATIAAANPFENMPQTMSMPTPVPAPYGAAAPAVLEPRPPAQQPSN